MRSDIRRALVAVFVARTAANSGLRVVYPFLPAIARGLSVSVPALAVVVALRNLGGLTTPLVARLAEHTGRRRLMGAAMFAVTAGCAMTAATSNFFFAAAGIVVVGIAKPGFDIPMQAWFGDRVPFSERGRVLGITELTWALSLAVIVPASGFLIAATSWRAPFVLVTLFAGAGTFAILRGIDSDVPCKREPRPLALTSPRRLMLGAAVLFSTAAEIPFVVYGQWLEGIFSLSVTGIGLFTLVVVAAELSGEAIVAAVSDRVGIRRMIIFGLVISALAYASFSLTGDSLVRAIVTVAVWIAAFECTIVATIPFMSELARESRDRLLSLLAVAIALGRASGALLAQPLYAVGGIRLATTLSGLCVVAALLLVHRAGRTTTAATSHGPAMCSDQPEPR
ncbi:MAG: MFS transporter [Actinomycetota bacterium]|nr:MFS transporter [Actinomycetota bacterium]